MKNKIENIKNKAKLNKIDTTNNNALIEKYKLEIQKIKNEVKATEPKLKALKKDFRNKEKLIKSNSESYSEIISKSKKIYVKYLTQCSKLNRLGDALIFFDKDQAKYVEVVTIEKFDMATNKNRDVRLIEYRESIAVRKMIQDIAIEDIDSTLGTAEVTEILNHIKSYKKVFEPVRKSENNKYYFNTYTPNGFLEVEVNNKIDIDNFMSNIMPNKYPIINSLFKNLASVETERKYLINWLSFILNTARKTRNAIALVGIQGTGKGVLQEQIIEYAVHSDNCYTAGNQDMTSIFNGWVENKLFLFFNEIKGNFNESSTQADKMKTIVTEYDLSLNDKFRKQIKIDNFANCMFFSNHDEFIQIEDEDRRYSVIKTEHRTLKKVASEDFNMDLDTYISAIRDERDSFLIEMKMIIQDKQSKSLALGLLENEIKNKIKDRTNTTRERIKNKILNYDTEWFKETIEDIIDGMERQRAIVGKKKEIIIDEHGVESVAHKPIISNFTNEEFKKFLIDEIKQGVFTNETLKWFSGIYELENIDNVSKYGIFWNTIINKSTNFTLITDNGESRMTKKIRVLNKNKIFLNNICIHGSHFTMESKDSKTLKEVIPF